MDSMRARFGRDRFSPDRRPGWAPECRVLARVPEWDGRRDHLEPGRGPIVNLWSTPAVTPNQNGPGKCGILKPGESV
jgi:hypothetical protein